MDFTVPEDQQELAGLVRRIAADQLTQARLRALDGSAERLDRDLWQALADAGVLAASLPASVDGGELDLPGHVSVLIELGRAVAPVPYLASIAVGAAALAQFGSDEQRASYAAPAATGSLIVTAALTEDLADSPETPTTRAERAPDGWLLTGAKSVVPHGTVADVILVAAVAEDGPRVFLVHPSDDGVTIDAQVVVDGDTEAALELVSVHLDDDRLLGGGDVLGWLIARQTVGLCALQLGVLERALELTATYAREREQFGRPIGSFQAVAQRLADAYIDVEAVRLTTWEAAWRLHERLPASAELATAKFWAADAGHRVAHTAVHVHGGTGIDLDGTLHRYFVAAKRNEFTLGAATVQLRRLGAELAATPV